MREIEVERPASEYAESRGWFEIKMMKLSKRGFPDRLYARRGRFVLVEWKAPGEPASKQQCKRHTELRDQGFEVHVIDNFETARAVFF